MANPYTLLAILLLALGLFGGGVSVGYKYEAGKVAAEKLEVAQQAADRARADAATESAAALQQAAKVAASRASSREKQHKLELELERDKTAKSCRVSDGTFGVLIDSIRSANGAPPSAIRIDARLPALPGTEKPISGRSGASTDGWLGRLRFLPTGKAGAGGVD
jgi:hypothetical protein